MLRPRSAVLAGCLLVSAFALPIDVSSARAAPPMPPSATYVVKKGDYLFGIAAKLKVRLAALLAANDLTVTSVIHPGDVLVVPAAAMAATSAGPTARSAGSRISVVVAYAKAQVGKPYRFAAAGPDAFDCSGLLTASYRQVGVDLPQYSVSQATFGTSVDWRTQPIMAGDLIFIANKTTGVISHVGIAVSSTDWVQAVGTGKPVQLGRIPAADKIFAVRRLIPS